MSKTYFMPVCFTWEKISKIIQSFFKNVKVLQKKIKTNLDTLILSKRYRVNKLVWFKVSWKVFPINTNEDEINNQTLYTIFIFSIYYLLYSY